MGMGQREQEKGSSPQWCRVVVWGMGVVSGRLSAFTVVRNGDMVLEELCWGADR